MRLVISADQTLAIAERVNEIVGIDDGVLIELVGAMGDVEVSATDGDNRHRVDTDGHWDDGWGEEDE